MENFGKYQLIRKLSTGGMAEVFLARSAGPVGFEKTLVLRRLLPHLAEEPHFVETFLAEARLTARLDHPNVVRIFDFGEHEGGYFVAMEYVDGPSLRDLCQAMGESRSALRPALGARLIYMACEGIAYAHDFRDPETGQWPGIVHRNVNPDTLLLSRTGTLKVVGFERARSAAMSETRNQISFGRHWYMAPEQLRRKDALDRRVDVYALGVVLYELLTGQKPYDATGEVELMRAILQEEPIPATRRRRDLPPELDRILGRALAPRDQRYATCQELQADLEQLLFESGEVVGGAQISRLLAELELLPQESAGALPPPSMALLEPTRPPAGVLPPPPMELLQPSAPLPGTEAASGAEATRAGVLPPPPAALFRPPQTLPEMEAIVPPVETRAVRRGTGPDSPADTEPELPRIEASAPEPRPGQGEPSKTLEQEPVVAAPAPKTTKEFAIIPRSRKRPLEWLRGPGGIIAVGLAVLVAALASAVRRPQPPPSPTPSHTSAPRPAPPAPPDVPPPPPPPSLPPPLATVRVTTEPSADVRVEGRLIGHSPVELEGHPPGVRIELSNPKLGFRKEVWVELAPGDNGVRRFEIQRLPVELRVMPRARIQVDERDLGDTSLVRLELFEGPHQVHLVEHMTGKEVIKDLLVVPGESNVFRYNLMFDAEPGGAGAPGGQRSRGRDH